MSTQINFYSVEETPVERDPTPEEMFSDEELMLGKVQRFLWQVKHTYSTQWTDAKPLLLEIEDYLKQAVDKRNGCCSACGMHWETCCCPVVDPFADD